MITHGEDVEIHALRGQGWSMSSLPAIRSIISFGSWGADRLPEFRDAHEVGDVGLLGRTVRSDEHRRSVLNPTDEARLAIGIPMYHSDATSYRMFRQPHTLGKMRLENQPEGSLRLYPIDLRPQIGTQG